MAAWYALIHLTPISVAIIINCKDQFLIFKDISQKNSLRQNILMFRDNLIRTNNFLYSTFLDHGVVTSDLNRMIIFIVGEFDGLKLWQLMLFDWSCWNSYFIRIALNLMVVNQCGTPKYIFLMSLVTMMITFWEDRKNKSCEKNLEKLHNGNDFNSSLLICNKNKTPAKS